LKLPKDICVVNNDTNNLYYYVEARKPSWLRCGLRIIQILLSYLVQLIHTCYSNAAPALGQIWIGAVGQYWVGVNTPDTSVRHCGAARAVDSAPDRRLANARFARVLTGDNLITLDEQGYYCLTRELPPETM
jgi:hypothetical protein